MATTTTKETRTMANLDISKLSYAELAEHVAYAQSQLDGKKNEEAKTLADAFLKKLNAAGFTAEEGIAAIHSIEGTAPKASKRGASSGSALKGAKMPAKYRGPNGEEWSGKGQPPKWMKPLLEAGKTKADFLIK